MLISHRVQEVRRQEEEVCCYRTESLDEGFWPSGIVILAWYGMLVFFLVKCKIAAWLEFRCVCGHLHNADGVVVVLFLMLRLPSHVYAYKKMEISSTVKFVELESSKASPGTPLSMKHNDISI